MKPLGRLALAAYRFWGRALDKAFSILIAGAFETFGRASVIGRPARLGGVDRIAIGDGVCIGGGSWLQTHALPTGERGRIVIGNRFSASGSCVISAAREIVIEDGVLFARNVYVADHGHEFRSAGMPVQDQGLRDVAPVRIGAGAWLGQNVVVCPGVTIGRGSVIGANSVVLHDVPDRCVAVGAPARVVRRLDDDGGGAP